MSEYMNLLGAEDVRSAANTIKSAASDINRSFSSLYGDLHQLSIALENMLQLHARAIACHCECLGMNAENASVICRDVTPPYDEKAYLDAMVKWEIVNKDYNPII